MDPDQAKNLKAHDFNLIPDPALRLLGIQIRNRAPTIRGPDSWREKKRSQY